MTLAEKVAVVTGSSRGIGRAMALALAAQGARVIVNYASDASAGAAVVAAITASGGQAQAVQANVGTAAAIEHLAHQAVTTFGTLDIWINNAGADILTGAARRLPVDEKLRRLFEVDIMGTFYGSRIAAEIMNQRMGGSIINIAWDHVHQGYPSDYGVLFGAAKGGVAGMSMSFARLYAPRVRVNVIAPGWIKTAWGSSGVGASLETQVIAMTPLARWGLPDDIADAAVFLASDQARFITGQVVSVNGGVVMG